MKHIRWLKMIAIAGMAMMAFAASASATTITSPTGTAYTGEIHLTSEGHVILKAAPGNIECHSTIKLNSLTHGPGVTAEGSIVSHLWGTSGNLNGTCTNSWHVTTVSGGTLQIHWKAEHEGTLTSTGTKITATRLGITCVYETNSTDLGVLTDSHKTGTTGAPSTGKLLVNSAIPINGAESGFLCGTGNAELAGSYELTTPDTLYIDQN